MKKLFIRLSTLAYFAFLASPVSASDDVLTISLSPPDTGVTNFSKLLTAGFTAAVVIAAIVMFAMLILGGYAWMTAGGDKAKVEEARTRITNGLVGLGIIAASWALMTVISSFFGVNFQSFNIPRAAGS